MAIADHAISAPMPASPGRAGLAPPIPVTATGTVFVVKNIESMARVRSEPRKSNPETKNVIAHLPAGHAVRAVREMPIDGFPEVETSRFGALVHGFVARSLLETAEDGVDVRAMEPATQPPPGEPQAV